MGVECLVLDVCFSFDVGCSMFDVGRSSSEPTPHGIIATCEYLLDNLALMRLSPPSPSALLGDPWQNGWCRPK